MRTTSFSQLSRPRQILIRLCQRVNYGSILNVQEIILDLKLDADLPQRSELDLSDFALCTESCRLLAQIDLLKNGVIERIVVHDGIPRRVVLRGPLREAHS